MNLAEVGNALLGALVILSGIAVIWALILGFKAIGYWVKSTFRGKDLPTRAEMAEFKENVEAIRAHMKTINGKEIPVK